MDIQKEYTYNKTTQLLMGFTITVAINIVFILLYLGYWSKEFASAFFSLAVILSFTFISLYKVMPSRIKKIIINKDGLLVSYWLRSKKQFNWERFKSLETGYSGGKICLIESYVGRISFRYDDFFGLQNGNKLVDEIIRQTNFSEFIEPSPKKISFKNLKKSHLRSRKTYKRL